VPHWASIVLHHALYASACALCENKIARAGEDPVPELAILVRVIVAFPTDQEAVVVRAKEGCVLRRVLAALVGTDVMADQVVVGFVDERSPARGEG
jgi:hypothetical protein